MSEALFHADAKEGLDALNRIRDGHVFVRCEKCGWLGLNAQTDDTPAPVTPCPRCGNGTATYQVVCGVDGCQRLTHAVIRTDEGQLTICRKHLRDLRKADRKMNERPGANGRRKKKRGRR